MKPLHHYNVLLKIIIFAFFSNYSSAQHLNTQKTMYVSVPLSDKISHFFEPHIVHSYNLIGFKVVFTKILTVRARNMVNAGQLDSIMVAEKEIEQNYQNLLRVPVLLAKGTIMLYCVEQVVCHDSALNVSENVIGVVKGNNISSSLMNNKKASSYAIKSEENLLNMLIKGRLDYVLITEVEAFGNLAGKNDENINKIEIYQSEGYHYIHKKHAELLPKLTAAMQASVSRYGALVNSSNVVKK